MRLRNTLILLVLLALLGGYVYFFEVRGGGSGVGPTPTPSSVQVLGLNASDVSKLTVEGAEGTVRLSRPAGGSWQMEVPSQAEADDVRVNSVVSSLAWLSASRAITETTDLEPFGLAAPSWKVEITLADGTREQVYIGDTNPAGSQYYVRKEGDPAIYLVYASTIEGLQRLVKEPPYPPTPTPTATPVPPETPTPTPTPES
ncbi:MAG: DUF4340 domain-containing protein [Anaerolineae bacterium]